MAKMSEYYGDPPSIPSSLWAMFDACAEKNMDSIALTVMHQPANHLSHLRPSSSNMSSGVKCLQWTFADLRHAAISVARVFHKKGAERGSTIVTLIPNGVECVLLFWVAVALQLTLAPLDPRLLDVGREQQLRDYMERLQPAIVVVPGGDGAGAVDQALESANVEHGPRVSLAMLESNRWHWLADLVPSGVDDAEIDDALLTQDAALEANGSRVGIILFTSGTSSGQPKGCPRSVRNLLAGAVAEFAMPDVPHRLIVHTPNSGAIAQAFIVMSGHTGRHIIIPAATFSPSAAVGAIEQFKAELLVAIPVMSRVFEKELAGRELDVSALRMVAIGGDMATVDAKQKFEELFPHSRCIVGHGMSEGHSLLGWRTQGVPSPYPEYHNILGIGHPQPGSLVRICDEEGQVVPRGEAGELNFGGPLVIEGYLEDAQSEAFFQDEKGHWMNTGDRAVMDEKGVIFIVGRTKDIIKKVGLALSPAVAESVVNSIEGVEVSEQGRNSLSVVY